MKRKFKEEMKKQKVLTKKIFWNDTIIQRKFKEEMKKQKWE